MVMRRFVTTAFLLTAGCSSNPTETIAVLSPRRIEGLVEASAAIAGDRSAVTLKARVSAESADSLFWAFRSSPDSAFVVSLASLERMSDGAVILEGSGPGWFFINFSPDSNKFTPLRRGATGSLTIPLVGSDNQAIPAGEYKARIRVAIYGVTEKARGVSREFGAIAESDAKFVIAP